jgi:hypothetical protein
MTPLKEEGGNQKEDGADQKEDSKVASNKIAIDGMADNEVGSLWQSREEHNNKPLMRVVKTSSGWQWRKWEDRGWQWWQKGVVAIGGIAMAKEEWSWHRRWQRHLGSGQQMADNERQQQDDRWRHQQTGMVAWWDVMQQPAKTDERWPHQRTRGARVKSGGRRDDPCWRRKGGNQKEDGADLKDDGKAAGNKVSMKGAADNIVGVGQQSREEHNNQPLMGAVKVSSG